MFCVVVRIPVADELHTNINCSQVDQGVVLLGVHHMKGGVTRGLLTKDVRSAEGWQISIDIFEYVQVKAQLLNPFTPTPSFLTYQCAQCT